MNLIIIRHGESVANRDGILQGQLDYPLSAKGIEQAKLLGKWLAREEIDVLYSSDLERANHTAEEIAQYHPLKVKTTELLREMNLGRFEGLSRKEIEERYPTLANLDWFRSGLADVEQIEQLYARAKHITNQLLKQYSGKKVVAVSHGGFINALLMALLGIEWQGKRVFTINNTSMTTIDLSNPELCVIQGVNETPHLRQKQKTSIQTTL